MAAARRSWFGARLAEHDPGMTSLKGNLSSVDLANIFQMLTLNSREGTLYIFEGASRKAIYFGHDGVSMLSKGRGRADTLGRILLRYDKVTPDQIEMAIRRQGETGRLLGQALVELELCTRADVDAALQIQIQEEVYSLFIWKDAQFEFVEGEPEEALRTGNVQKLTFNVNSVIMEAARRVDEWQWIHGFVPDTHEIFRYTSKNAALTDPVFQEPYAGKVLGAIDGRRSVDEIVEASYVNRFEVCKIIALLADAGAVERLPVPELRAAADLAVTSGDTVGALKFLSRLAAVNCDTPDLHGRLAHALELTHDLEGAARHHARHAKMLADKGQGREAFAIYRRICEFLPTDLAAAESAIEVYAANPVGLERDAEFVIETGRRVADAWTELKRPTRAIHVLHRVISLGAEDLELRNRLVAVYLAAGMNGEAIAEYEALAELALADGDEEQAERIYRRILTLDRSRDDVARRLEDLSTRRRRRRQNVRSLVTAVILLAVLGAGGWFGLRWWRDMSSLRLERETASAADLETIRSVARPLRAELDAMIKEVADRPADLTALAATLRQATPRIADVDTRANEAVRRLNELRTAYQGLPADDEARTLAEEISSRLVSLRRTSAEVQRALRDNADACVEQAHQMLSTGEATREVLARVELAASIASDCGDWLATDKGRACAELKAQLQAYLRKFADTKSAVERKIADGDSDGAHDAAVAYLTGSDFPPLDLRAEMPLPVRIMSRPAGARVFVHDGADTGLVTGPACIATISAVRGASFDLELPGFRRVTLTVPPVTDIAPEAVREKVRRTYDLILEKTHAFRRGTNDGRPVTAAPFASNRYAVVPSNRACDVIDLAKQQVVATLSLSGERSVRASGVVTREPQGEQTAVVPTGDGALVFFEASTGRPRGSWSDARGGIAFDLALAGGDVVAADDRGGVYCVGIASRQRRWSYAATTSSGEATSVAAAPVVAEGSVYVPCADGAIHVLDLANGSRVALLPLPGALPARPTASVAVADGCLYAVGRDSNKETRLTRWSLAEMRQEWSALVPGEVKSPPIPHAGTVFAVNSTGEIRGYKALDGVLSHSGAVDKSTKLIGEAALYGDFLYVGCDNGTLYALDVRTTDVQPAWRFPVRTGTGKPAAITTRCVAAGGLLLFGTADAAVYGLGLSD
jgi:outer membrane protein assembly factor BamB/tetratricopeptide (TPR) repeat protein